MSDKLLQKLPNPFLMENGELVKTKKDWSVRREQIKKTVTETGYGGMPPEPEFTEAEPLCSSRGYNT
jgi:hypothetical protein